jgi:hypothetical protein
MRVGSQQRLLRSAVRGLRSAVFRLFDFALESSSRELPRMRKAILIATCWVMSGCRDPRAEANIAQAMTEVGTTLNSMQQDYAILQNQVDSLRTVVARQDTIIGRLAGMAGLPYSPR